MKETLREFLEDCLKDASACTTHKDKHHYFDMAFGGAYLMMNYVEPILWTELNEIYEEYHAKFYEMGCL